MAKSKTTMPNAGEDAGKPDHSYIDGESVKWHSHSGKQFFSSKFHMTLQLHSWTFIPEKGTSVVCP